MRPYLFCFLFIVMIPMIMTSQSGTLDNSFSEDGIQTWEIDGSLFSLSYAGNLQPDGKILMAGYSRFNGSNDFTIVRSLSNGQPDPEFGLNGIVSIDFMESDNNALCMDIQPDGKILVAGTVSQNFIQDFIILRLMPDGSPDSTFGVDGWVLTDLGTETESPLAIALQPDGKIIVAGRKAEGFFSDFAMCRYHENGTLDSMFGINGIVETDFQEEDAANSIAVQPDGKIILGGFSSVGAVGDFALARYHADGTLDKSFGTGGKVLTDLAGFGDSDYATSIMLLPDGKILASGNANNNNIAFTSDLGIVRYNDNGSLDTSFGEQGIRIRSIGEKTNIEHMAVQPDGKILLCGDTDAVPGEKSWLVARLLPDGNDDFTFGNQGISTIPSGTSNFVHDVLIQPDTKIVLTGSSNSSSQLSFVTIRLNADFDLAAATTAPSCYNGMDGQIALTASGGTPPLFYSIDNGLNFQEQSVFSGLASGTYYIEIHDSSIPPVSTISGPWIIANAPPPPVVTIQADHDADYIVIHVAGDATDYLYSIDGGITFQPDSVFNGLANGTYEVVVLNAAGCLIHTEQVLISTLGFSSSLYPLSMRLYPNPAKDIFMIHIPGLSGSLEGVQLFDLSGKLVSQPNIQYRGNDAWSIAPGYLQYGCYLLKVVTYGQTMVQQIIIH